MLFNALRKMGLHTVELLQSNDFSIRTKEANLACNNSNLIVIEGSPEIDLLNTINHWKSRGKKVIVDIPLLSESQCQHLHPKSEGLFSISQIYSNYHSTESKVLDQSEKFRWGLHLADCIIVSSLVQQEAWSVTAPVRVIPEFIDFDSLRDKVRIKDTSFIVAIASNSFEKDDFLESVINRINEKYPKTKWLNISGLNSKLNLTNEVTLSDFPVGVSNLWPDFLPIVFLGFFWDANILRGSFYRNILELMSLHIPWVINDSRGYQDLSKYGLIIHNHMNWYDILDTAIQKSVMHINDSDEGYLYALSQNNDDHINEILTAFSEILKTPS
jgi:vacuolar-type H+-ATPase subunit F/Vma7